MSKVLDDKGVKIHLGTGVKEVGTGHALLSDGADRPDALRDLGRRHQGAPRSPPTAGSLRDGADGSTSSAT